MYKKSIFEHAGKSYHYLVGISISQKYWILPKKIYLRNTENCVKYFLNKLKIN